MAVFSFRAECQGDVDKLELQLKLVTARYVLTVIPDNQGDPDVDVQLLVDLEQRDLDSMIASVVDGHVMYQTLRPVPLPDNTLERDPNRIWPNE